MKKIIKRICPQCKEEISKMRKVCNLCNYRIYGAQPQNKSKDIEIVRLLNTGDYTLQAVGDIYNLSRERIRQIYKRETGTPYNRKYGQKRVRLKEQKKIESLKLIKFNCKGCGKAVTREEARYNLSYCPDCHYLWKVKRRDPKENRICLNCGVTFHPLRNWKSVGISRFHSVKCYQDFMRNNGLNTYNIEGYLKQNIK